MKLLMCDIGTSKIGIDSDKIVRVVTDEGITPINKESEYSLGLIGLNDNSVVNIIDIDELLAGANNRDNSGYAIIVNDDNKKLALRTAYLPKLIEIESNNIIELNGLCINKYIKEATEYNKDIIMMLSIHDIIKDFA